MLKAVLFDLDNTLIHFEEDKFFEAYSKKLYLSFADILTPEQFIKKLIYATQMMVNNPGKVSNAEFFIEHFADGISLEKEKLWQRFEKFYATEFEQFQSLMTPLKSARDIVQKVQARGLKTVIATNPMFPTEVQLVRLRWAGMENISFDLITSAENFNYCKPQLEYYQEIANRIEVAPEECLMVGNDPFNDMIASKVGMKTYLTTDSDHLSIELSRELAKNANLEFPPPDFKGQLKEILNVIDNLMQ